MDTDGHELFNAETLRRVWNKTKMKSQIEIKVLATVDLPDGWVQFDYEYTFATGEKVTGRTFHDGTLMGLLRAVQRDAWDELYKAGRRSATVLT